jgi:hypothetical protein
METWDEAEKRVAEDKPEIEVFPILSESQRRTQFDHALSAWERMVAAVPRLIEAYHSERGRLLREAVFKAAGL